MADDMGIGDSSAYLGKQLTPGASPLTVTARTPNLERLARDGTVFTDVHSPSSMCTATRYALLTGRYAWRTNQITGAIVSDWTRRGLIGPDRETLGTLFQRAGYSTAAIGKWHLGNTLLDVNGEPLDASSTLSPTEADFNQVMWPSAADPNVRTVIDGAPEHGFDESFGTLGNVRRERPGKLLAFVENGVVQGTPFWHNGPVVPDWDGTRMGEAYINRALDLIDSHAGVDGSEPSNKPLFMYYSPNANHGPWEPAETISIQGQSVPIAGQGRFSDGSLGDARLDMVHENDVTLGALLDKLQSTVDPQTGGSMIDNTLVIFTSDNGANRNAGFASGGLRGQKAEILEGGHRVPFIAAWPGFVKEDAASDQLFGLNDLYATVATLLDLEIGPREAEDSENILPALMGQPMSSFQRPGNLILHDNQRKTPEFDAGPALAIRSGSMKLIVAENLVDTRFASEDPSAGSVNPLALYDLAADPQELNNLLGQQQYDALVSELSGELLRIHNRGYSRRLADRRSGPLIQDDGGAELLNFVSGSFGYEFTVGETPTFLASLGMWDDAAEDSHRDGPTSDNPDGRSDAIPDGLAESHWVRLFDSLTGEEIAAVEVANSNSYVAGEFRYVPLSDRIALEAGKTYALTVSAESADGDVYRYFDLFGGSTSPITTELVGEFAARFAAEDGNYPSDLDPLGSVNPDSYAHRLLVGPSAELLNPADFDADGDVDHDDLLVVQGGLGLFDGGQAMHQNGDADGDGLVGGKDVLSWQREIGTGLGVVATIATPEPSRVILLVLAAACCGLCRGHRTSAV